MPKYINADELIENVEATFVYDDYFYRFIQEVEDMPAADVAEVVRCKDCKYWGVYDEPIKHCMKGMLKLPVHGYEFCCRGEKKE